METSLINAEGRTRPVASLAAKIGDVERLYDLARDKSTEARTELTQTVGALLEETVSLRERELVADVLIRLIQQAGIDVRRSLSERLSGLDNVSLRLVLCLANDEIEIATPMLSKSNVLGDMDLMYIIKGKTAEYWQVIAKRNCLSAQVIDTLADTKDFGTALALVENENVELTQHALVILSDIAQGSEVLAVPLLHRSEVTSDIATRLYKYVGEEMKKFIGEQFNLDIQKVSKVVDQVVAEFSTEGKSGAFIPEPHMIEYAKAYKAKGMLNVSLMISTLRNGHIRSFVAQLSVYTEMPVETIGHILGQTNGQGFAVLSKAFGIQKNDFISLFMLTSKIWNNGRLVDVQDIRTAIGYYDRVTPDLAINIIKGKTQN